jgi:ParB family chromosome partitioning protein
MAVLGLRKDKGMRTGTKDFYSVSLTVKDIPLDDIQIKENVRKEYTGIDELAESIRQHGLLQPITVYPDADDYIVKTGHRRFQAYSLLFKEEPERFHSIRCVVSNAENIAVVQLVENIQREDLSQRDLFNALSALRDQGMTHKQIAEIMGKSVQYIDNQFTGINEIGKNQELLEYITTAGGSIQDVTETKGISDRQKRMELLEQRKSGKITRSEMRGKAKVLKETPLAPICDSQPPIEATPHKVTVVLAVNESEKKIVLIVDNANDVTFQTLQDDLALFFRSFGERYELKSEI